MGTSARLTEMRRVAAGACRAGGVILPPLALVLAAGVYFRDVLPLPRPARYFGGDLASYFYPVYHYVAEELAAGRLPHWTPYVGVGYPLLADIEASVFYPPIRLLTLLIGPPSYQALELYVIAHFLVAGLGAFVLGRTLGLPAVPAGAGAVTFMFSGFFWAHSSHVTILQSAAWMPWLLVVHARALATRSATWTVAAAAVFALTLLGGHPQIAFYAGLASVLLGIVMLEAGWAGMPWRIRLGTAAVVVAVPLVGAALAAPQIAPTLSLAPVTERWDPGPGFLATDALKVDQLLTFLVPLAYYGTERFRSVDETYASVGIGALILAWAAVLLRRDVWTRYFGLIAVLGLALALGPQVPGFTAIAASVPVFGLFRASARATFLTDLGAAGLAALGLDAWARTLGAGGREARLRAIAWGWRALVVLALAGWVMVRLDRVPGWVGPLSSQFHDFYAYFVTVLLVHVGVLELWRGGWLQPSLAVMATLGLLLANLTYPHRAFAWVLSPPQQAWQAGDLVRQIAAEPGRQRVWNAGWLHRRGLSFEANAGLLDRLEVVSHYTSLPTARFDTFTRNIENPWREPALVDLLNVRHLILSEADTRPHRQGLYGPPRIEADDERRYDLRPFLGGPIGEVSVLVEPDPGVVPTTPASLVATAGPTLDVCLGCPLPPGGGGAVMARVDRAAGGTVELATHRAATQLRLRNRLPYAVHVRELRLDEVDLYTLGVGYRQLGPSLWENVNALPRAFLVEEVLVVPDTGRIIPTLLEGDPRRTAIVERPVACQTSLRPSEPPPPEAAAEIVEYTPTRVRLRTRHPRPAFLVLGDAHYKEWRAEVDGRRTAIHYADLLFRGVCVPAGEHTVDFRYRPVAFQRGVVIALSAGLLGLAAVTVQRRRPR